MNKVVRILMNRDGIDYEQARNMVRETKDEIECAETMQEVDDIIRDYLGLEPDYLEDILSI